MTKSDYEMSLRVLNDLEAKQNTPHILIGIGIAKAAIEKQINQSEWINVKDRLPDKNGRYLCCWGEGKHIGVYSFAKVLSKIDEVDFAGKNRPGWYDRDSEYRYEISSVTHWMSLPELPKE